MLLINPGERMMGSQRHDELQSLAGSTPLADASVPVSVPRTAPSCSRMIASYLAHIEHLLDGGRWQAARREAADLPQIAVALAHPHLLSSPERVRLWCQEWLQGSTDPEHLCQLVLRESVPARALRRLQLHRLARTVPREAVAVRSDGLAAADADAAQLSTTLVAATRHWYARSACHDPTVQSNLARLAVLR